MKDYLMALYTRFCDTQRTDETFDELCDDAAFAAFIAGFCLAGGIACELKDERYLFYDEVERTARLSAERGA